MTTPSTAIGMPFKEAVDYFRQKIDMPTTHWTAVMDEAHARSFMVAGAASSAIVSDFRDALDKAISKGTSFGEFRKDFDSIVAKHGWAHTGKAEWRAKLIYTTNLRTAFAAGRYAQMTDPDVLAAFPYWEYLHVACPHPRPWHVAWSGMILRADDPWWDAHYPPNGWNCHCVVANLGPRQLAARGKSGPDKAPPENRAEYLNRTTGVITRYPAGVDPGFAYNPGKAWKDGAPQPVKAPNVRPAGPMPPVLARPGTSALPREAIARYIANPEPGGVQIGTLHGLPLVLSQAAAKVKGLDVAAVARLAEALRGAGAAETHMVVKFEGLDVLVALDSARDMWIVESATPAAS